MNDKKTKEKTVEEQPVKEKPIKKRSHEQVLADRKKKAQKYNIQRISVYLPLDVRQAMQNPKYAGVNWSNVACKAIMRKLQLPNKSPEAIIAGLVNRFDEIAERIERQLNGKRKAG